MVVQTRFTEVHIADILKTRGPKLTQSRWELTVVSVGERAMLPKDKVISKKKVHHPSLSQIMLFVMYICFAIVKRAPQAG